MGNVGRNERGLAGGKGELGAGDGEVDRPTQDHGDLFFGMAVDGEDGSRLVDLAHEGLICAVDGLPGDAVERMLDRDRVPVDGGGFSHGRVAQKTNQPQKRASASRKKKTLATPPPKMR